MYNDLYLSLLYQNCCITRYPLPSIPPDFSPFSFAPYPGKKKSVLRNNNNVNQPLGFPGASVSRNAGDPDSIPGLGRCPGEEHGNPFQYSYLGNLMDRGAWWAMVHGVAKSWTQLSNWTTTKPTFSENSLWNLATDTHLVSDTRIWISCKPIMLRTGPCFVSSAHDL